MTGRFMWVMAVSTVCQRANLLLFTLKWGTTNPSRIFPPQLVMRAAGWDTKRNCREERLKKMEALMYSYSLTPFLLFCASTVLIIWQKQTQEQENPFLTSVTKPLVIYWKTLWCFNISSSLFFLFFLFIQYHLVPYFLNSSSEKTSLHLKPNKIRICLWIWA